MAGQRQVDPNDLELQPGVLMEKSPRTSKGRWTDADNVRWFEGAPEKTGGCLEQVLVDDDDIVQFMTGRQRSAHQWDSLDGQNWIAIGTHCKLYLINNDRLYDITPLRKTSSAANPFTTEVGSTFVLVSDPGHEAQDGDHILIKDASAVGGITLDGEYEVVQAIDLDTYIVEHSIPATATTTGGGAVIIDYDISCGLETDGTLSGFGTGDYGEGTYGTPREDSTFGGFARVWALDNWGEDLLASPNGETLFWWDRTNGPNSRAVIRLNAPPNIEFMLVGPDERHVIAFGTNLLSGDGTGVNGEQDKMFVRWCEGDDFDAWLITDENDAGSKRLDNGSKIVTAVKTRTQILVFTNNHLYGLSLVGGLDVYDFLPLGACLPPVSKMAVVDVDGIVYWMGKTDFYYFDGTIHVLPCEINSYVFDKRTGINREMASKVHGRISRDFTEIRWSFCSLDNEENDREAVYNWTEKCWYPSSMARESGLDTNVFYDVPVAFKDGRMFLHETGVDLEDDDPMVSFTESFEGEIAMGAYDMLLHELIPDFERLEGSLDVTVFGRNFPQEPREELDAVTMDINTATLQDVGFCKRNIGFHVESHEVGDDWRMNNWRVSVGPYGKR